jgi:hypothetical protein
MAVSVTTILPKLTQFAGVETVVKKKHGVDDIVTGILQTHGQYKNEYKKIAKHFLKPTVQGTCKAIFDFLKQNVAYNIEPETYQTLRSPAAILTLPADCKSYALFSCGCIDALRSMGLINCDLKFRFAGYDYFNNYIEHVFCVVDDGKYEYWIDPVLNYFNEKKQPTYIVDKNIKNMALVGIAGFNDYSHEVAGFNPASAPPPKMLVSIQQGIQQAQAKGGGLQKAAKTVSDVAAMVPGWGTAIAAVLKVFNFGNVPNPDDWKGWAALDGQYGAPVGYNAQSWVLQDGDSVQNEAVNIISWINNYGIDTVVNDNWAIKKNFGRNVTIQDVVNKLRRANFNQEADAILQAATEKPGGGGGAFTMGGGNMLTTLLLVGAGVFVVSKFAKK